MIQVPPRRGFFGRVAGAVAVGLTGLAVAPAQAATEDGPHWPGKLPGRYRQVVDGYSINDGHSLRFATTFLATNPPHVATSVVILRAEAVVMAMGDPIWAKYKLGEALKVMDPATHTPAMKNPFLGDGKSAHAAAIKPMLAAGVVFGACKVALYGMSKAMGNHIGVDADAAAKEWVAGLIPGITLIPSGVWGLNRAQLAGCSYCSGG